MGSLKPGATYIYESDGTRIYAREFGQGDRKLVGYAHGGEQREQHKHYLNEMNSVLVMCEQDPAMNTLLEQLFMLYNLKKTHE